MFAFEIGLDRRAFARIVCTTELLIALFIYSLISLKLVVLISSYKTFTCELIIALIAQIVIGVAILITLNVTLRRWWNWNWEWLFLVMN